MTKYVYTLVVISFLMFSCGNPAKEENKQVVEGLNIPKPLLELNSKIESNPKNGDLYNELAKYYFEAKDAASALKDIQMAISLDSTKANYFLTLSDVYFVMGSSGYAKAALEKCVLLDSKNVEGLLKLAELYLYVKQLKTSIQYLDKVLKIDINNPKAYFIKGMNFKELGDTAKAISSFETTVEQDPDYYDAFMQLGIIAAAKHNALAVEYFKSAILLNSKSIEAYYSLGMFYQDHGELNRAIEAYTAILQIDPKNKNANYNLGYIHFEYLKLYDKALEYFSKSFEADKKYYTAVYMRGLCYETLGNVKAAKADYTTAIEINYGYQKAIEGIKRLEK